MWKINVGAGEVVKKIFVQAAILTLTIEIPDLL